MKHVLYLLAILFAVSTSSIRAQTAAVAQTAPAQTGVDGTWGVDGVGSSFPWIAVLKADGAKLTGTVSSCASVQGAFAISEGTIDGNGITFKYTSGDGQRTITLTGRINGDQMAFLWELRVRPGGNPPNANNGLFAPSAPPQFTATRLDEAAAKRMIGIRWTGTAQNINGQGVVNANKANVSIGLKQVADPHWRWRDVGELTVATFTVPGNGNNGGTFELSSFVPGEKELSFSFNLTKEDEPDTKDETVQCVLPRRADGAYEGDCKGGGFRRHLTLNPPAAAGSK